MAILHFKADKIKNSKWIYWKSMIDSISDCLAPTLLEHDKCMSSQPNMQKSFLGKEFIPASPLHKAPCNQPFSIGGECNQTKVLTNI
jgi:hypothetical protein